MDKLKVFVVISTVLIVLIAVVGTIGLWQNHLRYSHLETMRQIECQTT